MTIFDKCKGREPLDRFQTACIDYMGKICEDNLVFASLDDEKKGDVIKECSKYKTQKMLVMNCRESCEHEFDVSGRLAAAELGVGMFLCAFTVETGPGAAVCFGFAVACYTASMTVAKKQLNRCLGKC